MALSVVTALFAGALAAHAAVVDRIAAVVNDDVITLTEVYALAPEFIDQRAEAEGSTAAARREAELEVLDELIRRRLISAEIIRLGLDVDDTELERTIDDIARRNGLDRDQLQAEVERSGLPWTQYRQELRENLRQVKFNQAVIRPRISVNDDELRDAYRRCISAADLPKVADLGAIFFELPADADEAAKQAVIDKALAARQRVDAGEAFAAVSAELDQGPYGAQGGKMGTYRKGELVGVLDEPAFALPVGGTSAPVETPRGYFVLHVFSRQAEDAPSFEDMKDQLFDQVYADRIDDETEQWYRQARRLSAVSIKLQPVTAE